MQLNVKQQNHESVIPTELLGPAIECIEDKNAAIQQSLMTAV